MKLAIVIGHDEKRKGAYGVLPLNKYEYDYNSEVAEMMFRFAMELGIQTSVFYRNKVGIKGCYEKVNDWLKGQVGCVIELHFNSFINNKVRGTETLFDNDPKESIDLAQEIHDSVVAIFNRHGKEDRGKKLIDLTDDHYERGEINFRECKHPMVIVEPFFGSNKEDATLGLNKKVEYAAALVTAAEKFLKTQYRALELH